MSVELSIELFESLNATNHLKSQSVEFGKKGLKASHIDAIEDQLKFRFPNDMRFFLENLHDPNEVFFPWRNFTLEAFNKSMDRILSGIEFDIEHNDTWIDRWGERPSNLADAKAVMRDDFKKWPQPIPVLGHRFLIAEHRSRSNPVLSIWQTDIICYGSTLSTYLANEFIQRSENPEHWKPKRTVPIWSNLSRYGLG